MESRSRGRRRLGVAVVVLLLTGAGVGAAYLLRAGPFAPTGPGFAPGTSGGFADGQPVRFTATGIYLCTPDVRSFYPSVSAAAVGSACEEGRADASAVDQVPQWALIPAFAGATVFGTVAHGQPNGYPTNPAVSTRSALLTDCGAGGSPTACPDNPSTLYLADLTGSTYFGRNGTPDGVFPLPAHDLLINTSTTFPDVQWGTIFVLVFDPYIFPNRTTGLCNDLPGANASLTSDCLSSVPALARALVTNSSFVASLARCTGCGYTPPGYWGSAFAGASREAAILGAAPGAPPDQLDSDLYVPYSVAPGAPAFP